MFFWCNIAYGRTRTRSLRILPPTFPPVDGDAMGQKNPDTHLHKPLVSQKQTKRTVELQFFAQGGTTPVMRAYAIS